MNLCKKMKDKSQKMKDKPQKMKNKPQKMKKNQKDVVKNQMMRSIFQRKIVNNSEEDQVEKCKFKILQEKVVVKESKVASQ